MKAILKTSYSQNNLDVFRLTTKNHAEYCSRHDYTYHPVEEPYNPYVDVDEILGYLKEYDLVCTMGVDLLIQRPEMELESFAHDGITMCRELHDGALNGDLILYKGTQAVEILNRLRHLQTQRSTGQDGLNVMYGKAPGIHHEPFMQVAAPIMNPLQDYRGIDTSKYFALHYHTIGKVPVPAVKYEKMKEDGL